jgi:hypothetical protein
MTICQSRPIFQTRADLSGPCHLRILRDRGVIRSPRPVEPVYTEVDALITERRRAWPVRRVVIIGVLC